MPDIMRLRYLGADTVLVAVLGRQVEPDSIVEFPGRVVEEGEDYLAIETGNPPEVRAWPRSRWQDETTTTKPGKE